MKKYCLQCGEEYYDKQQRVCQKDGALLALPDPYELIGQTIGGKYRIDALIGLGGWGAVYSAHQLGLERRVALKILQPNLATQSEGFIRDFEHEARVVARLAHENIVIVFDSGRTAKDIPYLAMEWLEGRLLEDALIEQGQLGFEQTAIILRQIVAALAVAHAERIVHRDLNPRNVMLVKQSGGGEQVKVLDFGIAKVLHTGAGYVTRVIGTPEYASPEQMKEGALIDERADIYSLGVMLYRMLTGEVPIKGKKEEHYIAQLLAVQPTPLHRLRPDVPMEIEKLVMEMLAKDMQPRPQNVAEVLRRFEAALPKRHSDIVTGADQSRSLGKIMINLKPQPDAIAEEHRERQHQPTMHKDFLRDEEGRPKRSPKITEPINRRPHASNTRSANRIGASNSIDRSPTVAWGN